MTHLTLSGPQAGGPTRRRLLATGCAGGLLALARCGSADPAYYTLAPWPGTPLPGPAVWVEVHTPSVAAFLDRDNIVREDAGDRLKLAADSAWASPLDQMIGRALALDLAKRLPGSSVYTQAGGLQGKPDIVVESDVSRFLRDRDGQAVLEATLSVFRHGQPLRAEPVRLTRVPADQTTGALVSALSALVGALADRAARDVRDLGSAP